MKDLENVYVRLEELANEVEGAAIRLDDAIEELVDHVGRATKLGCLPGADGEEVRERVRRLRETASHLGQLLDSEDLPGLMDASNRLERARFSDRPASELGVEWVEHYEGERLVGSCRVLVDGYELHTCPFAHPDERKPLAVRTGTSCPNRRFGCRFVAQEGDDA